MLADDDFEGLVLPDGDADFEGLNVPVGDAAGLVVFEEPAVSDGLGLRLGDLK